MKDKICERLFSIEKEHSVRILLAVESGSRAWGFESQDSDYDIRFIYAHSVDWYLRIEEGRDVIEYPIEELLDFSGWDVSKALQLFMKSNPPLYEWLGSPIVYIENGGFAQKLREYSKNYFSLRHGIYNYLHLADGFNTRFLQSDSVKMKKYFYVLRPVFACMWMERFQTNPPMEFMKMVSAFDLDPAVRSAIDTLYSLKKAGDEGSSQGRISIIHAFLDEKIRYFQNLTKKDDFQSLTAPDISVLNSLFQDVLFERI